MANPASDTIKSLLTIKLGEDHPELQRLIEKYDVIADGINFTNTEDDAGKVQQLLQTILDETTGTNRTAPFKPN